MKPSDSSWACGGKTLNIDVAILVEGLLTRTSWPVGFPIPVLGGDISIDPSICYWLPVRRQVDKGDEYEFFPAVPGKTSLLGIVHGRETSGGSAAF